MIADDTIFAVASGYGRSAVSVIRISGSETRYVLETLAGNVPEPRRLSLRTLADPASREDLDQALIAFMPGPHSFTGEDQAELHIHGGLATRAAVLRALGSLPRCRAAEPGEFTRRAFLNGRMDLAAVEGLADLIDAETEIQRRQALRQLEGHLGQQVETWRARLVEALALLETALDFSDEGDVPDMLERQAAEIVRPLRADIGRTLAEGSRGERVREGFTVVLAGSPNAGKSTLLNALAKREVAIVSPIPGTTRDAIEVRCDLGGLPVTFIDTAGLRESADPVEQEGIARARARVGSADLVLWLVPPDQDECTEEPNIPALRIRTKADLDGACVSEHRGADLVVSALTGFGLNSLLQAIQDRAAVALGSGDAVLTRERHRLALQDVASSLARAEDALVAGQAELAAEDVRLATRAIGRITGRVDVEEILDRIFASFCIGK